MFLINESKKYFYLIFLITLPLSSVDALRCYQCNSYETPECFDVAANPPHFINQYFKECIPPPGTNGTDMLCRKVEAKIMLNKDLRIIRECGYLKTKRDCIQTDTEWVKRTTCQCFGDGCNSAIKTNLSLVTLATTLLFGYAIILIIR